MIATLPVTYHQERLAHLWDALEPLAQEHWLEVGHNPDIPLEVDREIYQTLDDARCLRIFTVRDNEWKLVGYSAYFVRHSLHHRSSLQAMQDGIFILPTYREGGVGAGLINFADDALRAEGVQVVFAHTPKGHGIGRVFERVGYQLTELHYSRRLDK